MAKTSIGETLRKNIFIVLFIVLAVVASATIYYSVKSMSPTMPVIVAADNIKVGSVITRDMLATKYFPPNVVPPTAFTTAQDIIGKTVINGPIVHGDMIRQEHLSTEGSLKAMLHSLTPEGWHAIELPSGTGLGLQGLKKGDYVQIYGDTFTDNGLAAGVIVPDAIILSVAGQDLGEDNHIIAVPKQYVGVVADCIVKGQPMVLALPDAVPEHILLNEPATTEPVDKPAEENTAEESSTVEQEEE